MHSEDFVALREFNDRESLRDMVYLLDAAQISFRVDDSKSRFDVTYAHDDSRRSYRIEVAPSDKEKALGVFLESDRKVVNELPDHYYLFHYSDDELKTVIIRSFEWNSIDVLLAEKLLIERGINPDKEELLRLQQEALIANDTSEKVPPLMLVLGYLFCLTVDSSGLSPDFFGLVLAIVILTAKKTTSQGNKINMFDQTTQKRATYLLGVYILSILFFILSY